MMANIWCKRAGIVGVLYFGLYFLSAVFSLFVVDANQLTGSFINMLPVIQLVFSIVGILCSFYLCRRGYFRWIANALVIFSVLFTVAVVFNANPELGKIGHIGALLFVLIPSAIFLYCSIKCKCRGEKGVSTIF